MGAQQTAVIGRRRSRSWWWIAGCVSALLVMGVVVAVMWQASRERHAELEFMHIKALCSDVFRIVNTNVRADSTPGGTATEMATIEDVWSVIISENLSHDRCPACDCSMMINPDLAAWRDPRPNISELAVVCVRKGQSRHLGVDFDLKKVEVDTNRLPVWANY